MISNRDARRFFREFSACFEIRENSLSFIVRYNYFVIVVKLGISHLLADDILENVAIAPLLSNCVPLHTDFASSHISHALLVFAYRYTSSTGTRRGGRDRPVRADPCRRQAPRGERDGVARGNLPRRVRSEEEGTQRSNGQVCRIECEEEEEGEG